MSVLEIVLLIMGIVIFIGSFLIPEGKTRSGEDKMAIDENKIHDLVAKEVEEAQGKITDIVDETITYAMEKTERSMDRLTNEKMMAVNEYSDTVLSEINKNHQEVVFLYDMLNDKHDKLKNTVSEAMTVEGKLKEELEQAKFSPIQAERVTVLPDLTAESGAGAVAPAASGMAETGAEAGNARKRKSADGAAKEPARKRKPSPAKTKAEEAAQSENQADRKETAKHVDVSMAAAGKNGSRNNNEKIRELHKAGKSNMAIAKELGLGIGEVKLVLDLFADT